MKILIYDCKEIADRNKAQLWSDDFIYNMGLSVRTRASKKDEKTAGSPRGRGGMVWVQQKKERVQIRIEDVWVWCGVDVTPKPAMAVTGQAHIANISASGAPDVTSTRPSKRIRMDDDDSDGSKRRKTLPNFNVITPATLKYWEITTALKGLGWWNTGAPDWRELPIGWEEWMAKTGRHSPRTLVVSSIISVLGEPYLDEMTALKDEEMLLINKDSGCDVLFFPLPTQSASSASLLRNFIAIAATYKFTGIMVNCTELGDNHQQIIKTFRDNRQSGDFPAFSQHLIEFCMGMAGIAVPPRSQRSDADSEERTRNPIPDSDFEFNGQISKKSADQTASTKRNRFISYHTLIDWFKEMRGQLHTGLHLAKEITDQLSKGEFADLYVELKIRGTAQLAEIKDLFALFDRIRHEYFKDDQDVEKRIRDELSDAEVEEEMRKDVISIKAVKIEMDRVDTDINDIEAIHGSISGWLPYWARPKEGVISQRWVAALKHLLKTASKEALFGSDIYVPFSLATGVVQRYTRGRYTRCRRRAWATQTDMKAAADELKSPRIPKQVSGKRGQAEASGPLHRRSSRIAGSPGNTEAARKGYYPQSTPDSRKKRKVSKPTNTKAASPTHSLVLIHQFNDENNGSDGTLETLVDRAEQNIVEMEEFLQQESQRDSPLIFGKNANGEINLSGSR
ncbi:MAG: hypothetical protein Q9187_008147 [Circinaria calcarea]